MRRFWLMGLLLVLALLPGAARAEASAPKALTVMVYMCGSNLETLNGSATADIGEMLASGMDADRVNLVVMAGGSKRWEKDVPPGEVATIEFFSRSGALKKRTVNHEAGVNMGERQTLSEFIRASVKEYPAEKYALILWDHGAGPMGGICLDEINDSDRLSLSELSWALEAARLPEKLSWIGFDACLMSTVEVASAMAPYAEYMIASEETEPGTGWNYAFLKGIQCDADGAETGRRIVDLYFQTPVEEGVRLTLSCTDLSRVEPVVTAMDRFFRQISKGVDKRSFALLSQLRLASTGFGDNVRGIESDGYDLVDLMDLTRKYSGESDAGPLLEALESAVVYALPRSEAVGGLSVYHPFYNHAGFQAEWAAGYKRLSFCEGYTRYIERFGSVLVGEEIADWYGLYTTDEGFDADGGNWFSLQLSQSQQAALSSAQLIALYPHTAESGDKFAETNHVGAFVTAYSPVYIGNATMDGDGRLSALYSGRALYATDAAGNALLGPLAYFLSPDGETYYIRAEYRDASGREDAAPSAWVLFSCRLNDDDTLTIVNTQVYDPITETYTNRVALSPESYSSLLFDTLAARRPFDEDPLPGFDQWERVWDSSPFSYYHYNTDPFDLSTGLRLRFFDYQQSGRQMYIAFQITDVQQNTYLSEPVPVNNPNLQAIAVSPGAISRGDLDVSCYVVQDVSPLESSLSLCLTVTSRSGEGEFNVTGIVLNGSRTAKYFTEDSSASLVQWSPTDSLYFQISPDSLTGLDEIRSIEITATGEETPLVFYPQGCDVSGIAPEDVPPLAEAEQNGVVMQLTRLERDIGGEIRGVLHIINRSREIYDCAEELILEDVHMQGSSDWFSIKPDTDGYAAFTVHDSAFLASGLEIDGQDGARFLAEDHLLRRYAGEEISRVKILNTYGYDIGWSWQLTLPEPVSLGSAGEEAALEPGETLPLLSGDISVGVERLLVADNGVGVRLVIRNDTSEDACLLLDNSTLNGIAAGNRYPSMFLAAAHSVTVACAAIQAPNDLRPGSEITDVGLLLTCQDYACPLSRIRLKQPVMLGMSGGAYLACDALTTEPVHLPYSGGISLTPAACEGKTVDIRLSAWLGNERSSNAALPEMAIQRRRLGIRMEIENRSDIEVDVISTHLVLNGDLESDISWIKLGIPPHGWMDETRIIQPWELAGIDTLKRITCVLEVRRSGDYSDLLESIPLDIAVEGLEGAFPETVIEPLCETEVDGVIWQLLRAECDGEGRLTGWLYAVNRTAEKRVYSNSGVLVQGIRGDDHLPNIRLMAGGHQLVPFTFENSVRVFKHILTIPGTTGFALPQMDHLLQRHGIREITGISFAIAPDGVYTEDGERAPVRNVAFTLPAPLSVGGGAYEAPSETLLLREGGVSLWLQSVLAGDQGLSLALECRNDSDEVCSLTVDSGFVDDIYRWFQSGDYNRLMLPHSTQAFCVLTDGMPPGEPVQNVLLPFHLYWSGGDERDFNSAVIRLNAPVGMETPAGTLLKEADYTVQPAEPGGSWMTDALPLPLSANVYPKRLVAPLDGERRERFARGTAAILTTEPFEEDYEYETFSYEYVTMELAPDDEGMISAWYSGLTLCWSSVPSIVHERTQGDVTEFSTTLFEFEDDYLEYEAHIPDDPSQLPVILPAELPYYYEEGMELDPGVRTSICYRVQNRDGTLRLLESRVERNRLDTGEAVGEDYMPMNSTVLQNEYLDEDFRQPARDYSCLGDYGDHHPSLMPVEMLGSDIAVRYHIWYTDGTDEVFVEAYDGAQ